MCISCARAVTFDGTTRQISQVSAILPFPSVVMPIQVIPFAFASSKANKTFLLFQEVEIATNTSPDSPKACTCRAKAASYP